jgi:hypothetical protein
MGLNMKIINIFFLLFICYLRASILQVDFIVFSFNRPMQLYALLESTYQHVKGLRKIIVIYRSDGFFEEGYEIVKKDFVAVEFKRQGENPSSDFKPLLLDALSEDSSHILFGVDDIIVKDNIDLTECIKILEEKKAFGFYLRLGKNISHNYTLNIPMSLPMGESSGEIFKWVVSKKCDVDWGYSRTVDMTIYRKKDIIPEISSLTFHSPNSLEGIWDLHFAKKPILAICFESSKIINVPVNIVNKDATWNRSARFYSVFDLQKLFRNGFKIDVNKFYGLRNKAPHEELKYNFKKRY